MILSKPNLVTISLRGCINALGAALALSACVVTPDRSVVVRPSVEISYYWDNVSFRYYYVDRGRRVYMHEGWHDHRHPHGGPPGQRKHKHDRDDRHDNNRRYKDRD